MLMILDIPSDPRTRFRSNLIPPSDLIQRLENHKFVPKLRFRRRLTVARGRTAPVTQICGARVADYPSAASCCALRARDCQAPPDQNRMLHVLHV